MVKFEGFAFAAPPCTRTHWFLSAAAAAGVRIEAGIFPYQPPPAKLDGLVVSLVRNPYDWLVECFQTMAGGSVGVPLVDALLEIGHNCRTTEEFLRTYLASHAGAVEAVFDSYNASSVFRMEDFPWPVIELFEALGVPLTNRLQAQRVPLPALNFKHEIIDPQLRPMVMRAEKEFCLRYDYT